MYRIYVDTEQTEHIVKLLSIYDFGEYVSWLNISLHKRWYTHSFEYSSKFVALESHKTYVTILFCTNDFIQKQNNMNLSLDDYPSSNAVAATPVLPMPLQLVNI